MSLNFEGKTIFNQTPILLTFDLYEDFYFAEISKDGGEENKIKQIIYFENKDEFTKGIEKCEEFFCECIGETINIPNIPPIERIEFYSSDEFISLVKRLRDDLYFTCDICVSYSGGYNDFFHCLKCVQEGDGFNICLNCIENNEDVFKDHEDEFSDHKLIDHEIDQELGNEMLNIFIELVKDN